MPKIIPTQGKIKPNKDHTWHCPSCGATIKHKFYYDADRKKHRSEFKIKTKTSYVGHGVFESVIISCPDCDSDIEFTKEELET